MITDLTVGTGRFNLAQGTLGALMGIAASISTIGTGYIDEVFGSGAGFIAVTIIALLANGAHVVIGPHRPAEIPILKDRTCAGQGLTSNRAQADAAQPPQQMRR